MSIRGVLRALPALAATFGAAGTRRRIAIELRRSFGAFRQHPCPVPQGVLESSQPAGWPLRPKPLQVARATNICDAADRANRVANGEHQAFRWHWVRRPLAPEDWSRHPTSGFRYDPHATWHRVRHFDPAAGDIKDVWEPARFGWAYDLARGWMLTRDDRLAESFWAGFESFVAGCPPFRGVQWACGQETAVRAVAWLWCESALELAPSTTAARLASLREALAWSAERVADAIDYAESQRNNHGISEATALVAIGARLLDADPRAAQWLAEGSRRLERMVADQFAEDGWYIQHSFNYLRVALDMLVIAERVLRSAGYGLSPQALSRLRTATRLVGDLIDPHTGELPNHGANDGAYVLPLSTRPYRDFVPTLTAASTTFDVPFPHELEPAAEALAWLGCDAPRSAPPRDTPRLHVGSSGWVLAETAGVRLFARAGRYATRPGHIDPLHVDVWIDGRPVAVDAGTFRYAAPEPWRNGLADVQVHNTVSIEGMPPALRGPRFLWLKWPSARVIGARILEDGRIRVRLANDSWAREGIRHLRTCELSSHGLIVIDDITGAHEQVAVLHWLLDGHSHLAEVASAPDRVPVEHCSGDDESVLGWVSEGYTSKRPATSVLARTRLHCGRARFVTAFGDRRSPAVLVRHLDRETSTACST